MILKIKSPKSSNELQEVINKLYGELVSIDEFIDSIIASKKANVSLLQFKEDIMGYLVWFVDEEEEVDEDITQTIISLVIEEIVLLPKFREKRYVTKIIEDIELLAEEANVNLIDLTLPSQSFWMIDSFIQNQYNPSVFRVSKELLKKTEFVRIYTKIQETIVPEIVEVMASKNDEFQIELIESPKDYRTLIEEGYSPEIVSMVFYIEDERLEEIIQKINLITEWQEFAFSLIKSYED